MAEDTQHPALLTDGDIIAEVGRSIIGGTYDSLTLRHDIADAQARKVVAYFDEHHVPGGDIEDARGCLWITWESWQALRVAVGLEEKT